MFDFNSLLEGSFYMIAVFNNKSQLLYSNEKFKKYFPDIQSKEAFKDKTFSEEIFTSNRKCLTVDSPDMDGIVKFEVNYKDGYSTYIGLKVNYSEILKLGEYTGINKNRTVTSIQTATARSKTGVYATLTFDQNWKLRYYTDNVRELLDFDIIKGKYLNEIFGEDTASAILSKSNFLRIFEDVTLDIDGKMMVVSELTSGYKILNIYPYSSKNMNKFEEISYLKYKVKKLETEIADREKFIRAQKEIFKSLTTVDGLTKLYNRRYLIERFSLELQKIKEQGYRFSITQFHIKDFKKINMEIGYEKGDEILKLLSFLIKKRLNSSRDMAFRTGSAEFMVLSSMSDKETAREKFSKVVDDFAEHTGYELEMNLVDSMTQDISMMSIYNKNF